VGDDALKPTWIVGSALLVAFLIWKRRKLEPTLLAGGAIVAVAAFVYGLGLIHLPNLEQLLIDIGERLGTWTYLLVGGLAFLETGAFIGLIAPGETALLLGGVVAGQGQIEIIAMVGIVWAAAVAGDMTSFFLGRRLGRAFLVKHGPKVQITEERLHQVEGFFDRHGGKAILIGRFVGLVRAIAPFLAGSSGMPLRRFAPYDVVGAGLWGTTFVLLGYIFWQSFSTLLDYAKKGALGLGIAIVVIVGLVWLFRWQRVPENRAKARAWLERQAERPALRPLARVLRPVVRTSRTPARFVWDRVTPGELGLSLTTLVAIAGVGGFFFIADLVAVTDKTFVVGDQDSLRLADRLFHNWLVDIAKVVTDLGSLAVVAVLVLAAAVVLVWRKEVAYAAVLVVGLVLTYAGVHITKAAVDRPRPARALVEADGSSYPSAHAAYAMAWIAVAVALSRALPNVASRFAFVTVSIVIAAVVGLTRVYLRVHYISDVMGGWGLGGAIFAICGTVALVVAHLRNNAPAGAERLPSA
jgi:membrane protein DedA with SNARE-associated domain/membrane-associated phospholipid phosphatase